MKFVTRSLLFLLALYGVVFAIGDWYLVHSGADLWFAVIFAVVFIGLQYLVAPYIIQWVLGISWCDEGAKLPDANREFLERLCAERGLKMPRIGIIYSGTPNAFSFGHVPSDARVVVTSGLLEVLTPEESNAVLAHELGHVEHWDFAVMTIAALAPLLLYQIYIVTNRINNTRLVAYGAYVCYLLSQYVVLMLNRTREYFADHYAAEVTHAPSLLASALVKIAYGMVREEGEYQRVMAMGDKEDKASAAKMRRLAGTVALMGISNVRSGSALALAQANPMEAAAVMKWDLVNPWARFYELSSTHPLTALRVRELNRDAEAMHQSVEYPLPQDQKLRWNKFPLEFLVWVLPVLSGAALVTTFWFPYVFRWLDVELPANFRPMLLMALGVTWFARILYRYRGEFADANVGALLEDLEVSQMRPRAVRMKGKIVGRGEPGAFWSADLVLRDQTGIIFLLYRSSIPFARYIFGTVNADQYEGQDVVVEGWFRRGLVPYVEMSKLTDQNGKSRRLYSRWIQCAAAAACVVLGWLWFSGSI
ncbi:MAG TPA: M48 family metalloprotease [Candidatus Acidoferrum sp.]|jgi:heat shock protein HtpX